MRYQTHLAAGVLIGALFPVSTGGIITAAVGALLPDIDSPFSAINKATSVKNGKYNTGLLKHRGFMHTIWVPLVVLAVYWYLFRNNGMLPFAAGYLSHLFLDAFTRSGVRPFAPIWKKKFKGKVRTGSSFDKALAVVFLVALFFVVLFRSFPESSMANIVRLL